MVDLLPDLFGHEKCKRIKNEKCLYLKAHNPLPSDKAAVARFEGESMKDVTGRVSLTSVLNRHYL